METNANEVVTATPETVQSNVIAPDNSVPIRFVKVTGQKSPKSPKYRVLIGIGAGLSGLCLTGSIFQDEKTGGFSVMLPGASRFGNALTAAPRIITDTYGNEHLIPEADPDGQRVLESFSGVIMTAFHKFDHGRGPAAHRVIFG